MSREIKIGRSAESDYIVPADKKNVSSRHALIIVGDDGSVTIKDLDSTNGVYIADDNGVFHKVYSKSIAPTSVIRLGHESHDSFTFMAHHAISGATDYEYEFQHLKYLLEDQERREEELEKKNSRNMTIVKFSSVGALLLCFAAQYCIPGLKDDANQNLMISRIVMGAAPLIVGTFFGVNARAAKELKARRQRVLRCPKCNSPMSDYDIGQAYCSRCKAK